MLPAPAPIVVVEQDLGGPIYDYRARVSEYRGRKVSVRIEGDCASACTLLTALPASRVCVGPEARLAFHQAYDPADPNDPQPSDVENRDDGATALLLRAYPKRLRAWIVTRGGLTSHLLVLQGDVLRSMFRICR